MIFSLAEILLLGMLVDWALRGIGLPGFIGVLALGFALGPQAANRLDPALVGIGPDLRLMALIIIMLRAGFSVRLSAVRSMGWRLALLAVVPSLAEAALVIWAARAWLGLGTPEALMLGFIIPAVSPAVVVPLMLRCIDEKSGPARRAPEMMLAAASMDNVFNVVMADIAIRMYTGGSDTVGQALTGIPIALVSGAATGVLSGCLLVRLFERFNPRATKRTLLVIAGALLFYRLEKLIAGFLHFSGLMAALAMGAMILERRERFAHEIAAKLGKIWIFAEIMLFAMVGAQFQLSAAVGCGLVGMGIILCGVAVRTVATLGVTSGSALTFGERSFLAVSNLPKASIQAAMAGVPLAAMQKMGVSVAPGETILALAIGSILLTAPVGAWLIPCAAARYLKTSER